MEREVLTKESIKLASLAVMVRTFPRDLVFGWSTSEIVTTQLLPLLILMVHLNLVLFTANLDCAYSRNEWRPKQSNWQLTPDTSLFPAPSVTGPRGERTRTSTHTRNGRLHAHTVEQPRAEHSIPVQRGGQVSEGRAARRRRKQVSRRPWAQQTTCLTPPNKLFALPFPR